MNNGLYVMNKHFYKTNLNETRENTFKIYMQKFETRRKFEYFIYISNFCSYVKLKFGSLQ